MKTMSSAKKNAAKYTEAGAVKPVKKATKKDTTKREMVPVVGMPDYLQPGWEGGCSYTELAQREKEYAEKYGKKETVKKTPIQVVRDILGEVDEVVDELFARKKKVTFNMVKFMSDKNVDAEQAQMIADIYAKDRNEIIESKIDKELGEGYTFLTDKQKDVITNFYDGILEACSTFVGNLKRKRALSRKPRVKKPISAAKQVKKMNYCASNDEFGIVSVSPEYIVGAQEMWAFNVKTRKLTQFVASDRGGLAVKGSTIINFDPKKSVTKMVRKPEETLKIVTGGGKVQLRKLMDSLTTKGAEANGRMNPLTVILKTVK